MEEAGEITSEDDDDTLGQPLNVIDRDRLDDDGDVNMS